jgi:hypothetical protein
MLFGVKLHALANATKSPNWWKGLVESTYTLQHSELHASKYSLHKNSMSTTNEPFESLRQAWGMTDQHDAYQSAAY